MSIKRILLAVAVAGIVVVAGGAGYYEYAGGAACARCHEIQAQYNNWRSSTHRNMACSSCHGSALTFDVKFHLTNFRRVVEHLRGKETEQIHIKHTDLYPIVERCEKCHRQEFAQWRSGPHGSATYERIFLDKKHNTKRLLMDDCLRCHGMHFEGGIKDLVSPVNTKGPWTLKSPDLARRAAIPCMACHEMHRAGNPLGRPPVWSSVPGPVQEVSRPSLGLYDRREQTNIATKLLPLPVMLDGGRPVKMSPDQRQALCYQCHAPLANMEVGSGDDRTGVGVHEGISCLACHEKHGQQTRASCANCHPRLSNCGIDVEKMDTTFKDLKSKHNIHWVKCADCHEKGIPKRKTPPGRALAAAMP